MNFYQGQHEFYAGVDLHSNCLHVCVIDSEGKKRLHRNFRAAKLDQLINRLKPFQGSDLVLGCESTFNWYWLSDWCEEQQIPFLLGHAQYMKSIHGGKVKNDAIDSEKIAKLIRGGNFPTAFVYPKQWRATRDLMRRRTYFMRKRAELLGHIQLVYMQHNVPKPLANLGYKANRDAVDHCFEDPSTMLSVNVDVELIDKLDEQLKQLQTYLLRTAKGHDANTLFRLRTIPGIGEVLALTILYEIGSIERFHSVGDFLSYARLVRGSHTSNGKSCGKGNRKIGNAYLRWAFAEAASLCKRELSAAKEYVERLERTHGKPRAMTMLSTKLGRAVYYMLKREEVFQPKGLALRAA